MDKAQHWKKWAIDGMPVDKMRLAEATWEAALQTCIDDITALGEAGWIVSAGRPGSSTVGRVLKVAIDTISKRSND